MKRNFIIVRLGVCLGTGRDKRKRESNASNILANLARKLSVEVEISVSNISKASGSATHSAASNLSAHDTIKAITLMADTKAERNRNYVIILASRICDGNGVKTTGNMNKLNVNSSVILRHTLLRFFVGRRDNPRAG